MQHRLSGIYGKYIMPWRKTKAKWWTLDFINLKEYYVRNYKDIGGKKSVNCS